MMILIGGTALAPVSTTISIFLVMCAGRDTSHHMEADFVRAWTIVYYTVWTVNVKVRFGYRDRQF